MFICRRVAIVGTCHEIWIGRVLCGIARIFLETRERSLTLYTLVLLVLLVETVAVSEYYVLVDVGEVVGRGGSTGLSG